MKSDSPLKWLWIALCALFIINLIPWGFILKLLLIGGVIYFALNMTQSTHSTKSSEFSGVVSDGGSATHPIKRYVFSDALIDLTDSSRLPHQLTIQAALSNVIVRLPVDAGITVHASGALCSISLPEQQSIVIGQKTTRCGTQDMRAPQLYIETKAVLSSVRFQMG